MVAIADTLEDYDFIESPYTDLRDTILGQTDIYKKFEDISLFIEKYCREKQPKSSESPYWYYCNETECLFYLHFFIN